MKVEILDHVKQNVPVFQKPDSGKLGRMRGKRNTVHETNKSDNLPSLISDTTYDDRFIYRPPSTTSTSANHPMN